MQVRDVMTEPTVTESATDSLRAAAERMWRQQTGSLLVTDQGHLTGIITERDILRAVALGADPDRTTVDEVMTADVCHRAAAHAPCSRRPGRWLCAGSGTFRSWRMAGVLGVVSMRDVTGVLRGARARPHHGGARV